MPSETSTQKYFMKAIEHGYRTSLTTGGGFPDTILIHGDRHSFVELKMLQVGPSGDKKLKGLFKPTQPPWYMKYLDKGGTRLFVLFRLNMGYGVLHVCKRFVRNIDTVRYSDLWGYDYQQYLSLKDLIKEHFV